MRFEQLCVETRIKRRALREQQRVEALRRASPDWVEMDAQIKQLQLEAEMDAMEAYIDAGKPEIPILNFDLMPGFEPPIKREPEPEQEVHPDVKIQAELLKLQETRPVNENAPPPPGGKNWKYESTIEGLRPEDDWRNYE
jgi:hypothetical protein